MIRAAATPGSQGKYDYLLLREIGFVDRRSDEFHAVPDRSGRIVGLTHWDRYEVDMSPGYYFVSARSGTGPGAKTALLAGPYEHHRQALIRVQAAKQLALAEYPRATETYADLCFGTLKLKVAPGEAPQARYTVQLAAAEQLSPHPDGHLLTEGGGERNRGRRMPHAGPGV